MLFLLGETYDINNVGLLYRDYGLAVLKGIGVPQAEKIKKHF